MARKQNYLNNKDLLLEIHKSKKSYCVYRDPIVDSDFDMILNDVHDIFETRTVSDGFDKETGAEIFKDVPVMQLAKEAKAKAAAKLAYDTAVKGGQKVKQAQFAIDPNSYSDQDIVFRVTEWSHIPKAPPQPPKALPKRKKMIESALLVATDAEPVKDTRPINKQHVKVNFPPFFHWRLDDDGKPFQVAQSHWKGDYVGGAFTGEFNITRGTMTNKLALMFMKLCERYATKSNWRGYCVDEETEALTQRGWLNGDDITIDDKILSYDGQNMIWSKIYSIFRGDFDGLMHKLDARGIDSLATPEHKFVTSKGLVKVEHLLESDKVVLVGDRVEESGNSNYSDSFVKLIGWVVTEGNYQIKKGLVTIYQNPGKFADEIRQCLIDLDYRFSESDTKCKAFLINKEDSMNLINQFPNKDITMDFINSITADQRDLLLTTMINGDGWLRNNSKSYTQKKKESMDLFQALCSITGIKSNIHFVDNHLSFGKPVEYYNINLFAKKNTNGACINMHGGKRNGKGAVGKGKMFHPNEPTTYYKGKVWCPETEYGSFMSRRNGKAYLTGNTYNDEMRGQALLQLTQIGLQFDEAKSDNPFSYYTAVVNNAFTRILNIEKRNQEIRDDILEANDFTPSYTRQSKNDNDRQEQRSKLLSEIDGEMNVFAPQFHYGQKKKTASK